MGVYIDREQAIKCLDGNVLITRQSEAEAVKEYFEMVVKRLESVPTVDLVRCEECKHKPIKYDPEGDDFGFNLVSPNGYDNLCPCLNTDDGFYSYMPEDNFFCAFGERRADDD